MPKDRELTTKARVRIYETTDELLAAMYAEIQELAKKKPEATLNPTKVKMINRLLEDVRRVVADEPQIKYLDLLNDAELPQYSDVVLILSQYVGAMKAFSSRYFRYDPMEHEQRWYTKENP